jgi:hypothetical protein
MIDTRAAIQEEYDFIKADNEKNGVEMTYEEMSYMAFCVAFMRAAMKDDKEKR